MQWKNYIASHSSIEKKKIKTTLNMDADDTDGNNRGKGNKQNGTGK